MSGGKERIERMANFAIPPDKDEPLFTTTEECLSIMQRGIPLHYTYQLAHDVLVLKSKLKEEEWTTLE